MRHQQPIGSGEDHQEGSETKHAMQRDQRFAAQQAGKREAQEQQDRRSALMAAATSLGTSASVDDVFARAEQYLGWIRNV